MSYTDSESELEDLISNPPAKQSKPANNSPLFSLPDLSPPVSPISILSNTGSQNNDKPSRKAGTVPKPYFPKGFKLKSNKNIAKIVESSRCDICNKVFKSAKGLARHQKYLHQNTFHSYRCEICYKSYTRLDVIKRHLKTSTC